MDSLNENPHLTVKDLKSIIDDLDDDMPIVIGVDGSFGYATEISGSVSSTWDVNRVWVVKDEDVEEALANGEFPLEESLENGDMVKSVSLYAMKRKQFMLH